jgi:hypothetical protein
MKEKEGHDAAKESREAITDPSRTRRHETAMRSYLAGEAYAAMRSRERRERARRAEDTDRDSPSG